MTPQERTRAEARRYAILARYAHRIAPRLHKDLAEDWVQQAIVNAMSAHPGQDWLTLPTNYYAAALRGLLGRWWRENSYGVHTSKRPDTLDRLVQGDPEPDSMGNFIPSPHDTEREALVNVTLAAILDHTDDPGVRLAIAFASGDVELKALGAALGVTPQALIGQRKWARKRLRKAVGYV